MNKKIKVLLGIIILAVILASTYYTYQIMLRNYKGEDSRIIDTEDGTQKSEEEDSKEDSKKAAADFTVYDNDGNPVTLKSLMGKPIVLNFWASWCPPCKKEMKIFQKIYEQQGLNIQFVMVNMTDGKRETKKKAMSYITKNSFTFPVYFDMDQSAALAYYVSSIPTTYFIDKDGKIKNQINGSIKADTLMKGIEMIQ